MNIGRKLFLFHSSLQNPCATDVTATVSMSTNERRKRKMSDLFVDVLPCDSSESPVGKAQDSVCGGDVFDDRQAFPSRLEDTPGSEGRSPASSYAVAVEVDIAEEDLELEQPVSSSGIDNTTLNEQVPSVSNCLDRGIHLSLVM